MSRARLRFMITQDVCSCTETVLICLTRYGSLLATIFSFPLYTSLMRLKLLAIIVGPCSASWWALLFWQFCREI